MSRPSFQFALWLVARFVTLVSLTIPAWSRVTSDMNLFSAWMVLLDQGQVPSDDSWQYPPGVALVLWAIGNLHLGIGGVMALIVICDFVVLETVRGTPGGVLWAVAPLLMGPLFLLRLDTIVTALAVLAIAAGVHRWRGGVLLGMGASMKLWPLMLAAAYARKESVLRASTGVAAYIVVALVSYQLIGNTVFVRNQTARGLQVESFAAWPFMVAQAFGAPIDIAFRNGTNEISEPLADLVARMLVPTSIALVGLIALRSWRARVPSNPVSIAPRAVFVVSALLVTSRVLSPQFNVWLLGLVALTMKSPNSWPRRGVIAVLVTAIATQVLYPHVYLNFLNGGWLGLLVQTIRLVGLGVVLVTAWSYATEAEAGHTPDPAEHSATGARLGASRDDA